MSKHPTRIELTADERKLLAAYRNLNPQGKEYLHVCLSTAYRYVLKKLLNFPVWENTAK